MWVLVWWFLQLLVREEGNREEREKEEKMAIGCVFVVALTACWEKRKEEKKN